MSVPVLDYADDPDLTPVRLVSVFDVSWPRLGAVVISDSARPACQACQTMTCWCSPEPRT